MSTDNTCTLCGGQRLFGHSDFQRHIQSALHKMALARWEAAHREPIYSQPTRHEFHEFLNLACGCDQKAVA